VLELIDLFNRPIRPFGLDRPTLTIAKYCEKDWLYEGHGAHARYTVDKFEGQLFVPARN
jgi:hypothetical protein